MYEEGLLDADATGEDQRLDETVRSYEYDQRIVRLLTKKMMQLPSEAQSVLKAAACLGNELQESLLCHAGTYYRF